VLSAVGAEAPDVDDAAALKAVFLAVQELVRSGTVVSCHDVSDGGLIVTLLEMAFAGNKGWRVSLEGENLYEALFAEEAAVVVEVADRSPDGANGGAAGAAQVGGDARDTSGKPGEDSTPGSDAQPVGGCTPDTLTPQPSPLPPEFKEILARHGVTPVDLGCVLPEAEIDLTFNGETILREPLSELHLAWEETAYQVERLQANPDCAAQEWHSHRRPPSTTPYRLTFDPDTESAETRGAPRPGTTSAPRAAILREEGSNGDREMAAAFLAAGFEPWDVTMTDLLEGTTRLDRFQLVAFVGGFSFGDVLDSAKGWASVIRNNERLAQEFAGFFARPDALSLGVCNGCQLMALLGIPGFDLPDHLRPRFVRNASERFESRFSTVRIEASPALMLEGMEGSILGIWVAHGEGRLHVPEPASLDWITSNRLAPLRYVDPEGEPTSAYPYNPNGSPQGIAALCSPDGRHLALMPHPERSFQLRQWPWVPSEWQCRQSPWLRMFRNARLALR